MALCSSCILHLLNARHVGHRCAGSHLQKEGGEKEREEKNRPGKLMTQLDADFVVLE